MREGPALWSEYKARPLGRVGSSGSPNQAQVAAQPADCPDRGQGHSEEASRLRQVPQGGQGRSRRLAAASCILSLSKDLAARTNILPDHRSKRENPTNRPGSPFSNCPKGIPRISKVHTLFPVSCYPAYPCRIPEACFYGWRMGIWLRACTRALPRNRTAPITTRFTTMR